jgi:hypothetical protein
MTHREFLIWLRPHLDNAVATGLAPDGLVAIREQLQQMRETGALQPFASKLLNLVSARSALDAGVVAELAAEVRAELAPRREKTVVFSADHEDE